MDNPWVCMAYLWKASKALRVCFAVASGGPPEKATLILLKFENIENRQILNMKNTRTDE